MRSARSRSRDGLPLADRAIACIEILERESHIGSRPGVSSSSRTTRCGPHTPSKGLPGLGVRIEHGLLRNRQVDTYTSTLEATHTSALCNRHARESPSLKRPRAGQPRGSRLRSPCRFDRRHVRGDGDGRDRGNARARRNRASPEHRVLTSGPIPLRSRFSGRKISSGRVVSARSLRLQPRLTAA